MRIRMILGLGTGKKISAGFFHCIVGEIFAGHNGSSFICRMDLIYDFFEYITLEMYNRVRNLSGMANNFVWFIAK
ncbi:hypothetical protein SAMN05216238_101287 [Lentibacillus persicus]|uniref:Uncharacterized protein n=1 Tax=Lentibacillus persicus TaxID=640948 RepID=A0A1I1S824_9BACI|nr:hypothetical protein SAMN05216238_101287 [Lentibacillus persicus]